MVGASEFFNCFIGFPCELIPEAKDTVCWKEVRIDTERLRMRRNRLLILLRRDDRWKIVSEPELALAGGIVAVLVLAVVSIRVLGFAGYAQRVFFALLLSWMILVGRH